MTTVASTNQDADTWQTRLRALCGERGYENFMRRSVQTILLFEAKRCINHKLSSLRPFQRKAAYLDQCSALLDTLDFLYPHQRQEILWRTASSKATMDADIAWKRCKSIEKELGILQNKIKPFVSKANTHSEAVNALVQSLYESLNGFVGKPYPNNWEHAHNHVIMCYRLYYDYDDLDETFPPAVSPREIDVPTERPAHMAKKPAAFNKLPGMTHHPAPVGDAHDPTEPVDVADLLEENKVVDDRRRTLQEVRDHLELLKEFEGVISEEDLAKRKRELFLALPPAPSPVSPQAKKVKPEVV